MAATDPKEQGLPDLPNVTGYTDKNWAGGQMDQYGFTESLPGHHLAPYIQQQADKVTRERQEMFAGASEQALREGLGNLQTYRPGGAASLLSPYYQGLSQSLMARANMQYSPDLMHYYRWNQAHRARKAGKRAATIGMISGLASAGSSVLGGLFGGSGSTSPGTPPDPSQFSQGMGLSTDVPAPTQGPMQGPAGMPPTMGAQEGAPQQQGAQQGAQQQGQVQPGGGGTSSHQQPGQGDQPAPTQGPMQGPAGMPPTDHPLGANAGMAAQYGSDFGIPSHQAVAMAAATEDVGNDYPMLDFMEQQTNNMLFAFHELIASDSNFGGYLDV